MATQVPGLQFFSQLVLMMPECQSLWNDSTNPTLDRKCSSVYLSFPITPFYSRAAIFISFGKWGQELFFSPETVGAFQTTKTFSIMDTLLQVYPTSAAHAWGRPVLEAWGQAPFPARTPLLAYFLKFWKMKTLSHHSCLLDVKVLPRRTQHIVRIHMGHYNQGTKSA